MGTISQFAIVFLFAGLGAGDSPVAKESSSSMTTTRHHPIVDFDKWIAIFPIETFEKQEGPRQFESTKPGSPLDLWKAEGTAITSPADLCLMELVRRRVAKTHDVGKSVPVDVFLWSTGAPEKPYLTKLGGIPHREAKRPWPTDAGGDTCTFVAQFCFLDSKDIVSDRLPGDVMLIFFEDSDSCFGDQDEVHIEWAKQTLVQPMKVADCPKPRFPVPELSGVIHRCNEYPDSWDVFEQEGHHEYYLFPRTQSTKIGRETFYIQHDPRDDGEELLCALDSLYPKKKWPFVNMETLPADKDPSEPLTITETKYYGWGKYSMSFGDGGCMYFLIDKNGEVRWQTDSY